jgi:hypothetical protein
LTVLVSAAGDERLFEAARADIERHHIQMVIRIDEENRAVPGARARDDVEARYDFGRLVEHGRDQHARGLVVDRTGQPLRESLGWARRDGHDVEPFLTKTIE